MSPPNNVEPLHPRTRASNGGGSGGGDGEIRARLRTLEIQAGRIEERMQTMATQNDISKLKIWILGGVLSAFIIGGTAVFVSVARGWLMTNS